ncbi:hypothetical protein [Dactylosporangium fulvum]|uniref:Uncharacterized protein n=1 Tax=Dactylosporangium fulvum TaxID=53359 RepID=A0ABY5W8T6_9ACTN|nr:hypothetical protein [Dactylosporangium fulvum]UWP85899.1 hypothetical protein Dfulv_17270 [Dactylosporangium fulvum]
MSTTAIVVVTVGATIVGVAWAACWAAVRIAQIPTKPKDEK